MLATLPYEVQMAPTRRNPETLGELWVFVEERLTSLDQRIEASDRVNAASISRLVDSVKEQDKRLDVTDDIINRYIPVIPETVKSLEIKVRNLEDRQTQIIAGGGVLVAVLQGVWPALRAWLHIGGGP